MSVDEADAWIAWSALAEPLDAAAAALVSALGPSEALEWVIEVERRPPRAQASLIERVGPDVDARTVARVASAASRWTARLGRAEPRALRARAEAVGACVVTPVDPDWPTVLSDLGPAAPAALYVRGNPVARLLDGSVALVGSRAATAYGEHVAAELAGGLADGGRAVVSGGAYGIDAAAHRGALGAGGPTIAVMAGGIDRWYPAGTSQLEDAVLREGCVVSESPPGAAPHRSRFLSRNRLIACAGATVVVEAAHRSGALSTARHALELGRPVGAVPGPITSAASAGAHALVRDTGAVLVTGASDVLELVGPLEVREEQPQADEGFASQAERAAYDALGLRGATLEAVAVSAALTLAEARAALASLAARGQVALEAGIYRRIGPGRGPASRP